MSAIATTILTFTRPGEVILHSQPLYGGTETLVSRTLTAYDVEAVGFADGVDEAGMRKPGDGRGQRARFRDHDRDALNPLNTMVDIKLVRRIADEIASRQHHRPIIVCDNTLLAPSSSAPCHLVPMYRFTR
jgi:methionine-gamma-lyase